MLKAILADITKIAADAVVNAANSALGPGTGVNGAIRKAAGLGLVEECRVIGHCPTGEARVTGGYDLPARHVIHTVGPVWRGGGHGEPELLAKCYLSCLSLAASMELSSIAFPCISTGVFGYPGDAAAKVAVDTVRGYARENPLPGEIVFCCFSEDDLSLYERLLGRGE